MTVIHLHSLCFGMTQNIPAGFLKGPRQGWQWHFIQLICLSSFFQHLGLHAQQLGYSYIASFPSVTVRLLKPSRFVWVPSLLSLSLFWMGIEASSTTSWKRASTEAIGVNRYWSELISFHRLGPYVLHFISPCRSYSINIFFYFSHRVWLWRGKTKGQLSMAYSFEKILGSSGHHVTSQKHDNGVEAGRNI